MSCIQISEEKKIKLLKCTQKSLNKIKLCKRFLHVYLHKFISRNVILKMRRMNFFLYGKQREKENFCIQKPEFKKILKKVKLAKAKKYLYLH